MKIVLRVCLFTRDLYMDEILDEKIYIYICIIQFHYRFFFNFDSLFDSFHRCFIYSFLLFAFFDI